MVRVKLVGGRHSKDGQTWTRGDVFEVTEKDYRALAFKFEKLPDRSAGREPPTEEAWEGVDATDAAVRDAVELGLTPSDVEGTGKDGRVLVGDVRG